MRCSACGSTNADESRFCEACGLSLAAVPSCPRCKAPSQPGQHFCNACGAVLANAATAFGARIDATVARGDLAGLDALVATEVVDHRTGRRIGHEERLASIRALVAAARQPVSQHEPLAALGDSLALSRRTLSASGFDGETFEDGAYRIEELCVIEIDRDGRTARTELFAVDRLGDALARLYQRYADRVPVGRARTRAAEIARSVATVLGPPEPDRVRPALALDVRYADHRALGWGTAHGVVAFVRALRTLRGALASVDATTIEVVAARTDALLVRRTVAGELTGAGDRYRRRPLVLWCFGADGRVNHWEQFDGDQRDHALARFDELAAPPAPPRLFETVAAAAVDRFDRAWASRNWNAVMALHAREFHYSDRRAGLERELDREDFLARTHPLFELQESHSSLRVLATRGERLVLIALGFALLDGEGKPSPTESLMVIEVNERGDRVALVQFDAGDRIAAHVELDARYAAREATQHPEMWAALWDVRRALAAHDWDRLARLVSADLVAEDHRPMGWGIARSAEQYAALIRPHSELRPDVALRLDHLLLRDRTALFAASWTGGGPPAFEIPVVIAFRANRDGRIDRIHHYNVEQIDAARARLDELGTEQVARTSRAFCEAFARRDWSALAALLATDVVVNDHRQIGWETLRGTEAYLEALNGLVDLAPDVALRLDHIEMSQRGLLWIGAWVGTREGGAFEMPWVTVSEHGERGTVLRFGVYDLDQVDAARAHFAEL